MVFSQTFQLAKQLNLQFAVLAFNSEDVKASLRWYMIKEGPAFIWAKKPNNYCMVRRKQTFFQTRIPEIGSISELDLQSSQRVLQGNWNAFAIYYIWCLHDALQQTKKSLYVLFLAIILRVNIYSVSYCSSQTYYLHNKNFENTKLHLLF